MSTEVLSSKHISSWVMSRGCFASACTSCPGSSRWTGSKRTGPSRRFTASASSGSSSLSRASSAPTCPPASPPSPPMGPRDRTARHACAPDDQDTSSLLAVRRRLQSRRDDRPHPQLLPCHRGRPSGAGGELGAAYVIPIIYVPLLMITHFAAFYLRCVLCPRRPGPSPAKRPHREWTPGPSSPAIGSGRELRL